MLPVCRGLASEGRKGVWHIKGADSSFVSAFEITTILGRFGNLLLFFAKASLFIISFIPSLVNEKV
jgi:hypothetical protein